VSAADVYCFCSNLVQIGFYSFCHRLLSRLVNNCLSSFLYLSASRKEMDLKQICGHQDFVLDQMVYLEDQLNSSLRRGILYTTGSLLNVLLGYTLQGFQARCLCADHILSLYCLLNQHNVDGQTGCAQRLSVHLSPSLCVTLLWAYHPSNKVDHSFLT
jgi:hypothetical protein